MELKVISSGSIGNAYVLQNKNSAILIECGVKLDEIKNALNFNTLKLDLLVCSHEHL